MKYLGENGIPFPESVEEAAKWEPTCDYCALARMVLVVAKTRVEGVWSAYCDTVPGQNHDNEYIEVLRTGDKIPEQIARVIFPRFDGIPYAR